MTRINQNKSSPAYPGGAFNFCRTELTFVIISALRTEDIGAENYNQQNNNNDPFPAAKKTFIIVIAHLYHLAYIS